MNKRFAASAAAVLTAAVLCVPASAHCGHGRAVKAAPKAAACAVCTVEDCETLGRHEHDGVIYCGYDHPDGVCSGECRALCQVEGCTIAGRHVHDGQTYCGSSHECGFCDGSCQTVKTVSRRCGGHHGHH